MNWHSEVKPVAPAYIQINTRSGWQTIIPAERFRGISAFKGDFKVYLTQFHADGDAYVDSFDITDKEYERIAIQLGFIIMDEDD